jgi:hypothetical protein
MGPWAVLLDEALQENMHECKAAPKQNHQYGDLDVCREVTEDGHRTSEDEKGEGKDGSVPEA